MPESPFANRNKSSADPETAVSGTFAPVVERPSDAEIAAHNTAAEIRKSSQAAKRPPGEMFVTRNELMEALAGAAPAAHPELDPIALCLDRIATVMEKAEARQQEMHDFVKSQLVELVDKLISSLSDDKN